MEGKGWADTWTLSEGMDVVINLGGLDEVELSEDRRTVRIGGGSENGALIEAASAAEVEVCKWYPMLLIVATLSRLT